MAEREVVNAPFIILAYLRLLGQRHICWKTNQARVQIRCPKFNDNQIQRNSHLFAGTYYQLEKDLSRLADLLGHSSVNTTKIYTMESGTKHAKQL